MPAISAIVRSDGTAPLPAVETLKGDGSAGGRPRLPPICQNRRAHDQEKTMRVFQIQDDWGMDHLQLATRSDPKPGPGQVLLRIKAASVNYRDLVVPLRGYGSFTGELPLIPGSDGAGEVVEVGAGVTRVKVGERVCPCFQQGWIAGSPDLERLTKTLGGPIDGTMADLMCLP